MRKITTALYTNTTETTSVSERNTIETVPLTANQRAGPSRGSKGSKNYS